MAQTTIRGTQIRSGTITDLQISASAAIATSKLADGGTFFFKDGSRTATGAFNLGSHQINAVTDPSLAQDAATKNYVDTVISSGSIRLPPDQIWIGNSSSIATPQTFTGDMTVSTGGVTTVSTNTSTGFVKYSNVVIREVPSGSINGTNTSYTIANTPVAGYEEVFLNGVLQEPGASNDYTITTVTIAFVTAPISGDIVLVNYYK